MVRIVLMISAAAIGGVSLLQFANAAAPVTWHHCSSHQRELDLKPLGTGPLELAAVYCQVLRFRGLPKRALLISPDARCIAYYRYEGTYGTLSAARLDAGNAWTEYPADMEIARFGSAWRTAPAFAWSSDSRFLWAANRERVRPGGFAKSALQPVTTASGGVLWQLPPLRHDAGPLDALLWVDGDGLAVAQFGTKGNYYRPTHEDNAPLFAIVDARRGRVRDTLAFDAIESLKNRVRGIAPGAAVTDAVATKLPDGRVRVLLSVRQWVVWTEGEMPRVIVNPYAAEQNNQMVMSPDGSRVLVGPLLRTNGAICYRVGGCRPGRPVEGILAALHDLGTGQLLWSIRATVTNDLEFPAPAISPDGRYALVGLVPEERRSLIALIAMEDGKIVQTFPSPGGDYAMGFARNGQTVWTHAYGLTALYDVRADAR